MAKTKKYVTADDVRHFLLDRAPDDNFLLDSVEVDSQTILKGMEHTVDIYNTMRPLYDTFDVEDFPYRAEMIQGTAAYCLRAMAINHARNNLRSTAQSGTQVRDRDKMAEYLQLAREVSSGLLMQFRTIKRVKNVESCYGIVS